MAHAATARYEAQAQASLDRIDAAVFALACARRFPHAMCAPDATIHRLPARLLHRVHETLSGQHALRWRLDAVFEHSSRAVIAWAVLWAKGHLARACHFLTRWENGERMEWAMACIGGPPVPQPPPYPSDADADEEEEDEWPLMKRGVCNNCTHRNNDQIDPGRVCDGCGCCVWCAIDDKELYGESCAACYALTTWMLECGV